MAYLIKTCDFCNNPADGKATRTNGLCKAHLDRVNSIPKKAGKRLSTHALGSPITPTFGGGTGFKARVHGSGF